MLGLKYRNVHSFKDLGLTIAHRNIGSPSKNKYEVTIPGSNQIFDFSSLYGEQTYSTRELQYTFNVYDQHSHNSKVHMNVIRRRLINAFMPNSSQESLFDDAFPGFYFKAEVVEAPVFFERGGVGQMTIAFRAYPFMMSQNIEGNDIWDIFNFEFDMSQQTKFRIIRHQAVTLHNVGDKAVNPLIIATDPFQVTLNGETFLIPAGETEMPEFFLKRGANQLEIVGFGDIEFKWRKEVL